MFEQHLGGLTGSQEYMLRAIAMTRELPHLSSAQVHVCPFIMAFM